MSEKKGKKTSKIKKYTTLAVICLLTFTFFWLIFNEFQARPTTPTAEFGRSHALGLNLRTLLLLSRFLLALTIAGVYILWKLAKPSVIIKTVSEPPSGVSGAYESLKMLRGDDKLVISTIVQSKGEILQKELTKNRKKSQILRRRSRNAKKK